MLLMISNSTIVLTLVSELVLKDITTVESVILTPINTCKTELL